MADHVKICFRLPPDDSGVSDVETMWATTCGDGFKIDNIPFYAKGVSLEDIVSVTKVHGLLYMDEVVKPSGHSTVRIWFANENEVPSVRETLKSMGCTSEISDKPRLIAVDVPPNVAYSEVKQYLDEGRKNGKWDYQEACLGFL